METMHVELTPGEGDLVRRCLLSIRDELFAPRESGRSATEWLAADSVVFVLNDLVDRLSAADVHLRARAAGAKESDNDRSPF